MQIYCKHNAVTFITVKTVIPSMAAFIIYIIYGNNIYITKKTFECIAKVFFVMYLLYILLFNSIFN